MNLIGVLVNHKTFGEGIIKQYDANYLVISFSQGEKKFVYPDVFESFISVNESNIAKFINLEIEKKKRNKIKQQNITNEKKNLVQQKPQQNINPVSKPSLNCCGYFLPFLPGSAEPFQLPFRFFQPSH
jgi:hypothetical protein